MTQDQSDVSDCEIIPSFRFRCEKEKVLNSEADLDRPVKVLARAELKAPAQSSLQ